MRLQLSLKILCIFSSQVWLIQTQQSVGYADFLNTISSFVTSVTDVLSGPTELKTLRDAPGCGKRNTRDNFESTLAECLWDCEWEEPNDAYKKLYGTFVRTPVRWNGTGVDDKATYDDPKQLFPDDYVDYIELVYGREEDTTTNFYVDQYLSLPRLPKDTRCIKDCIYPANIGGTRIRICVQAYIEWLEDEYYDKTIADKFPDERPPLLIFYECMIALNVETLDDVFEDKEIRRSGKSFSRDYKMLAVEICFLVERDYYLYIVSDEIWTDFSVILENSDLYGCFEIYELIKDAILNPDTILNPNAAQHNQGQAQGDRKNKIKPEIKKSNEIKNNTKNSVILNYRDYGKLAEEDIILRKDNKRYENRLTGASVFPTDLDLAQNSQHHPWACSLRTRGYRGRHRCGVTLLYGPMDEKPETHDYPYVLVSAAHCNYICKDRIRGDVQETCCCRPPDREGSCAPNAKPPNVASPFCTGQPVFVLAEPEDMIIVCGEFNSGTEIINESWEPEQVFTVTKIIQHPNYKATTADIGRGSGGPIDGNDIAVYHVDHHGFLLGENVYVRDTPNPADQPELKSSESYIWPACLPKDDTDERFDPDTDLDPSNPYYIHPNRKKDTVNAMLAGWLDAPPISQAFSNLLGSSLSEADVLKLYYYPRVMGLEELEKCTDPKYQRDKNKESNLPSSTFYPKGTICFKDPSASSCPEFGSSGSGVVRAWAKREDKKSYSIDNVYLDPDFSDYNEFYDYYPDEYQYSFVGPLSMQKGCDNAFHMYTKAIDSNRNQPPNNGIDYDENKLSYRGENPLVFTDARCFMPWIASQYNMKLEKDYKPRDNCEKGTGNRDNVDQEECYANFLGKARKCDFTLCENIEDVDEEDCTPEKKWDRCRVLAKEGIAFNVNQCLIKLTEDEIKELDLPGQAHYRATCFNNCKGVNPNAITAAGVALVAVSGISSTAGLGPGAVGIGGAILAGREVMTSMNRVGEGCCRMGNRACQLVPRRGMMVCPRNPRGCRRCT